MGDRRGMQRPTIRRNPFASDTEVDGRLVPAKHKLHHAAGSEINIVILQHLKERSPIHVKHDARTAVIVPFVGLIIIYEPAGLLGKIVFGQGCELRLEPHHDDERSAGPLGHLVR